MVRETQLAVRSLGEEAKIRIPGIGDRPPA
jgi:hypothetical protein